MTDIITITRPDGSVIKAAPGQISGVFLTGSNDVNVYLKTQIAPLVCRHATPEEALAEVEAITATFAGGQDGN